MANAQPHRFRAMSTPTIRSVHIRHSMGAGAMLGIGLMAAVDEIVFHQILGWHHFFDRSTPAIGLASDGVLHATELLLLVAGFMLYARLRANRALASAHARAGLLLGLGGFQLFDGIVDHKILRLHQIRYVDNLWLYDLVWNGAAIVLLAVGAALAIRARSASDPPPGGNPGRS